MLTKLNIWKKAQQHEVSYYEKRKISTTKDKIYAGIEYWEEIMNFIISRTKIPSNEDILADFGCVPNSILSVPLIKKSMIIGIYPLIDYYNENFILTTEIVYVKGVCEYNMLKDAMIDFIFNMNSLDHTQDPGKCIKIFSSLIKSRGYLIISLNCHRSTILKLFFSKFYKIIDPPHPHHFMASDLIKACSANNLFLISEKKIAQKGKGLLFSVKHRLIFEHILFIFQRQ